MDMKLKSADEISESDLHSLWLWRFNAHLTWAGGILLGACIAAITVLFVFILLNRILHVGH
jgi:hypothetical protein